MSFRDYVWYSNPLRAGNKALLLSNKTAESIIIVRDNVQNMFGIKQGNGEPELCRNNKDFDFIATIHPLRH